MLVSISLPPPTSEGGYRNTFLKKQALVEALATIVLVILCNIINKIFFITTIISGVGTDLGGNLLEECTSRCTA